MKTKHENGFTLYELLVTLLIIGVVLTIGVPNMSEFTANSRMATTANDLHSSFMLARSEAARSKTNITVCASANSLDAAANCNGTFDDGWIIFVDLDGDLQRAGAGENVLRRHEAIDSKIDININNNATYFSYAPTGLGRGDVGGVPSFQTAVLCDDRGNQIAAGGSSSARYLVVTPIGRATVVRDESIIASKGGCP
jgi:type IV fimbrial biogenesis protein FimT